MSTKPDPPAASPLTRREALRGLGTLALSVPILGATGAACGNSATASDGGAGGAGGNGGAGGSAGSNGDAGAADAGTDGGADGPATCTVYPEETEGPYYLDLDLLRRDVTEGKAGTPLALTFQIVSAAGCAPMKDVAVDIWQCDAGGVYSGFPGQLGGVDTTGQKFLRGTQVTGGDGRVTFDTVYPGWYPGRTTHIHFKVHKTKTASATSQLYFPEETTSAIYKTAPYDARGQKDTSNASDGAVAGKLPPLVTVTADGAGYRGALVVTVSE